MVKELSKLDIKMLSWLMAMTSLAGKPIEMRTKEIAEYFEITPRKVQKFVGLIGEGDPYLDIEKPARGRYVFANVYPKHNLTDRGKEPLLFADAQELCKQFYGKLFQDLIPEIYAVFDGIFGIENSEYLIALRVNEANEKGAEANGKTAKTANNANETPVSMRYNANGSGENLPETAEEVVESVRLMINSFALNGDFGRSQQLNANRMGRINLYVYIYKLLGISIDLLKDLLLRKELRKELDLDTTYLQGEEPAQFRAHYSGSTDLELALADVCKIMVGVFDKRDREIIEMLIQNHVSAQELHAYYGKPQRPNYWWSFHWKGLKHQYPEVIDVGKTIMKAREHVPHVVDTWPTTTRIIEQIREIMIACGRDSRCAGSKIEQLGYEIIVENIPGGYIHMSRLSEKLMGIEISKAVRRIREEAHKDDQ